MTGVSSNVERLARVMRVEHIPVWMTMPLEALAGERPRGFMARGDHHRVAHLIANPEEPSAV